MLLAHVFGRSGLLARGCTLLAALIVSRLALLIDLDELHQDGLVRVIVLSHLVVDLLLTFDVNGLCEPARYRSLHFAKLWLRQVLSALPFELSLLLAKDCTNLVHQGWSLLAPKCFLRPSGLVVGLAVAIHGHVVGASILPDLMNEVFLPEHLIKMALLASVYKVQPLLERLVPLVIRWDVIFITLV